MNSETKKCPMHEELFPKEEENRYHFEFYESPSRSDGLSAYCKRCARIKRREERAGKRRASNMPGGVKDYSIRIPVWLDDAVKQVSDERGITKSRLINEAIKAYIVD